MNKTFLYIAGGIVALVLLYFVFKNQISNTVTKAEGDSYNVSDDKSKVTQEYAAKIAASTDSFEKDYLIKERDEKLKELDEIANLRIIYKQEYSATAPSYYTYGQLNTAITNKRNEKLAIAVKEYKKVALKAPSADLNTPEKIYSAIDTINAEKEKIARDNKKKDEDNQLRDAWNIKRARVDYLVGQLIVSIRKANAAIVGDKFYSTNLLTTVSNYSDAEFIYWKELFFQQMKSHFNEDAMQHMAIARDKGTGTEELKSIASSVLTRWQYLNAAGKFTVNEFGQIE